MTVREKLARCLVRGATQHGGTARRPAASSAAAGAVHPAHARGAAWHVVIVASVLLFGASAAFADPVPPKTGSGSSAGGAKTGTVPGMPDVQPTGQNGACCLDDGQCILTAAEAECHNRGGVYQGDGTTCPPPGGCTGRCCLLDGTFVQTSEFVCVRRGGFFQGNGVAQPCRFACCLPGDDCDGLTKAECENSGGVFLGPGYTCDGDVGPNYRFPFCPDDPIAQPCVRPGGCWRPDLGTCVDMTAYACFAAGGEFFGPGVLCADVVLAPDCPAIPAPHLIEAHSGLFHFVLPEDGQPIPAGMFQFVCLPRFDDQGGFRRLERIRTLVDGRVSTDGSFCANVGQSVVVQDLLERIRLVQTTPALPGLVFPITVVEFDAQGDPNQFRVFRFCEDPANNTGLGGTCELVRNECDFLVNRYQVGGVGMVQGPGGRPMICDEGFFGPYCVNAGLAPFIVNAPPACGGASPSAACPGAGAAECVVFEFDGTAQVLGAGVNFDFRDFPHVARGTVTLLYEWVPLGACCFCPDDIGRPDAIYCVDGISEEECYDQYGLDAIFTPFVTCDDVETDPKSECYLGSCCIPEEPYCIYPISIYCCEEVLGGQFYDGPCGDDGVCCIEMPDGTYDCVCPITEVCCDYLAGTLGGTVISWTAVENDSCVDPDDDLNREYCDIIGYCCVQVGTTPQYLCLSGISKYCCENITAGGEYVFVYFSEEPCPDEPCTFDCPDCPPKETVDCNCGDKGSIVVFSKIEVRWDASGRLLQDTFVTLSNDWPEDVRIYMIFLNGDPPLEEDGDERAHPGWNFMDVELTLTGNQPVVWAASSGAPYDVAPWTSLDPGPPPGRPADDGSDERMLRGAIYAWAIDGDGRQIRWNHLAGQATLVRYDRQTAWEYNACALQSVANVEHGSPVGVPETILLNGIEYCLPAEALLFNFQTVGSLAWTPSDPPFAPAVTVDTDVTLHPLSADFRLNEPMPDPPAPPTTAVIFEIYNENEDKFCYIRCLSCWEQQVLSRYLGNPLGIVFLQTDHAKARLCGRANPLCNVKGLVSQDLALLGVYAREISLPLVPLGEDPTIPGIPFAKAGSHMQGQGGMPAVIRWSPTVPPKESPARYAMPERRPFEVADDFIRDALQRARRRAVTTGR